MSTLQFYRMLWVVALALWFAVLVLVPLAVLVDAPWPGWSLVGWIVACFDVLFVSVNLYARHFWRRE